MVRMTEFQADRLPRAAPIMVAPERDAVDWPVSTKMV
jgi:hypothetical protein